MTPDELRQLAVEHVMRVADDVALVLPWQQIAAGSGRARTELGRLLWETRTAAVPGSPLDAFVYGTEVDDRWRDLLPTVESSVWGELQLLRQLYGNDQPNDDLLLQLQDLRAAAGEPPVG